MLDLIWAICASVIVSLVSFVGIVSFLFNEKLLNKILILLIAFAAGGLIGGAFLHLLPEALEHMGASTVFLYVILGFIIFFIMEKFLHWRHCHEDACKVHPFAYVILAGDAVHNFIDGLVIGASFTISFHFGLITTLVIILHEIPQEFGDFAVLIYGGINKIKALYYNFIIGLTCVAGTVLGFYLSKASVDFFKFLLPITAGGFVYIAACDLVPELHKQRDMAKSVFSLFAFLAGILFIYIAKGGHSHGF